MHLGNVPNDYQAELGEPFGELPKAVLAAIAVSALTCGGDQIEVAKQRVAQEWETLHRNGIVPKKPGRVAKSLLALATST